MMPAFHVFPGPPPSVEYMTSKTNAPSFFLPAEIRRAIMQKHALAMMTVDAEQAPSEWRSWAHHGCFEPGWWSQGASGIGVANHAEHHWYLSGKYLQWADLLANLTLTQMWWVVGVGRSLYQVRQLVQLNYPIICKQ